MALNMLIYGNLWKFMQIRKVCANLKSTMTKSTECYLDGKMKLHYHKVCRNVQTCHDMTKTRFCVEIALCRNSLCRSE